jgi:hypothetical protein
MTAEEIRRELDGFESQVIELAGQLIACIAEIRCRLILFETRTEIAKLTEADGKDGR